MPPALAGNQRLPDTLKWTVSGIGPPSGAPVIVGAMIVVPLQGGTVAGHRLDDGSHVWTVALAVERPLATDAERVYVVAGDAIHALDARTGEVEWRAGFGGAPTATPLAHAGWVIVAAVGELFAFRATDGHVIWRQPVGPVEFRPSLDGQLLVVSVVEGFVLALEVQTGRQRWQRDVGSSPSEPLAIGDRVYVGTLDKRFHVLDASSGEIESNMFVGAKVLGRAAVYERHVHFAALDNVLWTVDRNHGAIRWRKGLQYRPAAGPVVIGTRVVVPGPVDSLPAFDAKSGESAGVIAFGARLVQLPLLTQPAEGAGFALGITGTLETCCMLTLLEPSLVPPIAVQPLTVLPGEAMPLPVVPVVGGRS